MEHVAGLLVLCMLTVLTACAAALPDGALAGAQIVKTMPTDPGPRKSVVAVDQPLQPLEPPISRERSLVLDTAFSANSNAAIIVFLLKHPGDRFSEMARISLRARRTPDSAQALHAAAGDDADLVAAFDAARLANSDAAWSDFLSRYGDTPLAAEVPKFR
jgi:hypothetical protein